jgi:acetyl esterase
MIDPFLEHDVSFGAGGSATLFQPNGSAKAAIVDVHGGAWTSGDRAMNIVISRYLAARGIAVLAIDFAMPPVAAYPAVVAEVSSGLDTLATLAPSLGCDARNIGILGTSSGGHLALLAALRPFDARYGRGDAAFAANFVVACWPVSDPAARYQMVRGRNHLKLIDAHHAFWRDEEQMVEGSPFAIVERGEAQRLPPLLIVQGTSDENLTPDMQKRFVAVYRERGGRVDFREFEGAAHGFITSTTDAAVADRALAEIVAFIERCAAPQLRK